MCGIYPKSVPDWKNSQNGVALIEVLGDGYNGKSILENKSYRSDWFGHFPVH